MPVHHRPTHLRPAYITAMGRFLPGLPVPNDQVEDYLGSVGPASGALRDQTMANTGIHTRYYAIDQWQRTRYSVTDMAAEAIRAAVKHGPVDLDDLDLIAAGSTAPDLIAPGLASMVHGALGNAPCEIISTQGVCNAGMMALKSAYLQVASGGHDTAVAVASELASRAFRSQRMAGIHPVAEDGSLALEVAFLRYMLSDGAGAAVVQPRPAPTGVSLRIDWITLTSYANTADACMYCGMNASTATRTWWDYADPGQALADGALSLRQDLRMLPHLVAVGLEEYHRLLAAGWFDPDGLRWLPVHYSSERMRQMILTQMRAREVPCPDPRRWYSNLRDVGNIGSASIYVILEEILTRGLVEPGDTLLCMVPESGRFSVSFMHLTGVTAADVPAEQTPAALG